MTCLSLKDAGIFKDRGDALVFLGTSSQKKLWFSCSAWENAKDYYFQIFEKLKKKSKRKMKQGRRRRDFKIAEGWGPLAGDGVPERAFKSRYACVQFYVICYFVICVICVIFCHICHMCLLAMAPQDPWQNVSGSCFYQLKFWKSKMRLGHVDQLGTKMTYTEAGIQRVR